MLKARNGTDPVIDFEVGFGTMKASSASTEVRVLTSVPHLRITRRHGGGAAMRSRSVLVHCPRRLGAAVAVLAAELQYRDGALATRAGERRQAVDQFDGVMPHSSSVVAYPGVTSNQRTKVTLRTRHMIRSP